MCSGVQVPPRLYGIGKNGLEKKQFKVLNPADAKAGLQQLFDAYLAGQVAPVALFPKTAWAYAESGDESDGIIKWQDSFWGDGERADGVNPFIYKGNLPDEWVKLADQLVKDIFINLEELNEAV
jgi:exonuclease V gamma subunit